MNRQQRGTYSVRTSRGVIVVTVGNEHQATEYAFALDAATDLLMMLARAVWDAER